MNVTPPDWLIDWLAAVNLWDALLPVVAIVGAFIWLRKVGPKAWSGAKALAHAILNATELLESVKGLPQFMERTDAFTTETTRVLGEHTERIASIHHEVNFNTGGSVKDSAIRTERQVKAVFARLGEVQEQLGEVRDEIVDLHAADRGLREDLENTQPTAPKEKPHDDQ
ncbi:hypothetical protein SK224_08395 [Microbacterium sp. BG28]|uniref:hypothetical protein n=1 Tax=Microbacterium sp. BG28 TaxID=3097356 RepID=UPI002A598426|nr:hypothetical protein [Microbacterium sp. BG28]MDY0829144.1 hypothetical protein [Microbacterium sp. BG28]